MTSIEWLIEEMLSKGFFKESVTLTNIDHLQYKAEEMHKQEIIDAVDLPKEKRWYDAKLYNSCGEQYYQKTFLSKGSDECYFEPTTNTSSATICKHCGREKFLHTT